MPKNIGRKYPKSKRPPTGPLDSIEFMMNYSHFIGVFNHVLQNAKDIRRTDPSTQMDYADFDFIADEAERFRFEFWYGKTIFAVKAALQLHSVYENVLACQRMAARYPWKDGALSRAQHLHFAWMLFLNFAYQFKEQYKNAANSAAEVLAIGHLPTHKSSIGGDITAIEKKLKKFIADRNNHIHNWHAISAVTDFSVIETARRLGGARARGLPRVTSAYAVAKNTVCADMNSAASIMEQFINAFVARTAQDFGEIGMRLADALTQLDRKTGGNAGTLMTGLAFPGLSKKRR